MKIFVWCQEKEEVRFSFKLRTSDSNAGEKVRNNVFPNTSNSLIHVVLWGLNLHFFFYNIKPELITAQ
jgi:hypothetical protein